MSEAPWGKVLRRIWQDARFRALSNEAKLAFFYLLTAPGSTQMPGVIEVSAGTIADALRTSREGVLEGVGEGVQQGMVVPDWEGGIVFLPNALKHQPPPSGNNVAGWAKVWDRLPESHLLGVIWDHFERWLKAHGAPGTHDAFVKHIKKPSLPARFRLVEEVVDPLGGPPPARPSREPVPQPPAAPPAGRPSREPVGGASEQRAASSEQLSTAASSERVPQVRRVLAGKQHRSGYDSEAAEEIAPDDSSSAAAAPTGSALEFEGAAKLAWGVIQDARAQRGWAREKARPKGFVQWASELLSEYDQVELEAYVGRVFDEVERGRLRTPRTGSTLMHPDIMADRLRHLPKAKAPEPEEPRPDATPEAAAAWETALERLRESGNEYAISFLVRASPTRVEDGSLRLQVNDRFFRDWCQDHYGKKLEDALGMPVLFEVAP